MTAPVARAMSSLRFERRAPRRSVPAKDVSGLTMGFSMRQSSKTAWVKSQPERSASEKSTPMSRCLRKL